MFTFDQELLLRSRISTLFFKVNSTNHHKPFTFQKLTWVAFPVMQILFLYCFPFFSLESVHKEVIWWSYLTPFKKKNNETPIKRKRKTHRQLQHLSYWSPDNVQTSWQAFLVPLSIFRQWKSLLKTTNHNIHPFHLSPSYCHHLSYLQQQKLSCVSCLAWISIYLHQANGSWTDELAPNLAPHLGQTNYVS